MITKFPKKSVILRQQTINTLHHIGTKKLGTLEAQKNSRILLGSSKHKEFILKTLPQVTPRFHSHGF